MSCLFDSLSHFVKNMNGKELRKEITSYISKDPVLIDSDVKLSTILQYESQSIGDYVNEMVKESTWGGGIEIKAFCEMFHISVHIHIIGNDKVVKFYPSQNNFKNKYIEIFWNGNHFSITK
jgi:hypothetical protein